MAVKKKRSRGVSSTSKSSARKASPKKASPKKASPKKASPKKASRTKAGKSPRGASRKKAARKAPAIGEARRKKASPARRSKASAAEDLPTDLLDLRAIEYLSKLMDSSGLQEIEVRDGPDRRLRLSRRVAEGAPVVYSGAAPVAVSPVSAAPGPEAAAEADSDSVDADIQDFASPMVGTFYRAPSPEASSYVTPGDKINPDTVLCIIEAMKVMNEVRAEVSGEVVDVLVENGEAVEYGQPLFHIRTSR